MMLAHRNLYEEMRLQPTASHSEIRSAYRRAALLAHPDKGGSTAAFHSVAFAFEVLSCPTSRNLYDHARGYWLREQHLASQAKTPNTPAKEAVPSRPKRKRKYATPTGPAAQRQQMTQSPEDPHVTEQPQADEMSDDVGEQADDHPPPPTHATHVPLDQLCTTLWCLAPADRKTAIAQMPLHVRKELLAHMSHRHAFKTTSTNSAEECKKRHQKQEGQKNDTAWSRGTDVRTIKNVHQVSYQAQLRIRHLRMYTHSQADLDTAISHQMILAQARHAIDAAGEEVWNHPDEFCNVFAEILRSARTSQEELGLSVFIFMRADEWISRCATITSPVVALGDAVAAHARLLAARQTSWARLRTEWVFLMRQTQHARLQRLSQAQAEAVAEKARLGLLQRRLKLAVSAAERAIGLRYNFEQKAMQAEARRSRCAAKEKHAQKRAAHKRKQREQSKALRRWYHRVDLTTEQILEGKHQGL